MIVRRAADYDQWRKTDQVVAAKVVVDVLAGLGIADDVFDRQAVARLPGRSVDELPGFVALVRIGRTVLNVPPTIAARGLARELLAGQRLLLQRGVRLLERGDQGGDVRARGEA